MGLRGDISCCRCVGHSLGRVKVFKTRLRSELSILHPSSISISYELLHMVHINLSSITVSFSQTFTMLSISFEKDNGFYLIKELNRTALALSIA